MYFHDVVLACIIRSFYNTHFKVFILIECFDNINDYHYLVNSKNLKKFSPFWIIDNIKVYKVWLEAVPFPTN